MAFLAGCWEGPAGEGVVEERWSVPAGGVMLGWSRTLRPGGEPAFAQLRIQAVGDSVRYGALTGGLPPGSMLSLAAASPGDVAFAASPSASASGAVSDGPDRVRYRLDGEGALVVAVHTGPGAGTTETRRMRAVDCP